MAIDPGFDVQAVYRRALEIQAAEQAEQQRQLQAQEHDRRERARLAQEAAERNRSRTWGEVAADTGLGLAQTVVNVGGAAYGLGNMATLGMLDRAVGLSGNFEETNQILDSYKSAPLRGRHEDLQGRFDAGDYMGAAGELLTTPSLLGDYAVQSLGYLVPGMAASRVAGGVTAARGLASGLSREAAGAAAQTAATRAALGAQSGMTAGYMNVDAVNAAREAGRTEEEQQLYGLGAGAVGAVLGPAISRVTGAAGMEARAAQAFSGTALPAVAGGLVTRTAAGVGVQALEEGAQESYEQVLRNWAAGNDLTEAVPQSAITGAILGGLFGGVLGATSGRQNLRDDIADAQQDIEQNLDAEGNVIQPSALSDSAQPEAPAAPDPVAAEALTPVAPVETPIVTPAQEAPLTGARAVLAARDARMAARQRIRDALTGVASQAAQRTPQPLAAQEATVEDGAEVAQPAAPNQELTGAHRAYVEKAPLAAIRRRYGDAVAAQEAQRRGPDALPLDEVAEYFGAEAMYQQYARRPQDLPTTVPPADPVAPAPIDLTVPKTKRDYLSSMRSAVAEATGKTPASISGKHWVELVDEAAAEGITPASPEFSAFMAVRADAKLRQAELEGKSESQLLGSIVAAFPQENIDPDVLLDAQIAWGGVTLPADADLDVLFPRTAAVESLREVTPEVANNWLNEEHRAYVEGFVAELVEGGDVGYVRDENDRIVGRTPSINPDWWKDMDPDVKPNSVRDAKAILAKAQAGERLGKKQAAFLAHLLDMADAQVSENRAYREQQAADTQRERSQAEEAERIEREARAAAAQVTPVEDAPGASRAAREESSEGTLIRAYADAIAAVETAEDLESLNTVVRTVRGAPTYLEFTYQQKMELESRIAEQWGRLDGYSFRLGDKGAESVSPTQTDTPAFKRWFGVSKVVDAQGRPLVVYHGTNGEFYVFDMAFAEREDSWSFSDDIRVANTYRMQQLDPEKLLAVYRSATDEQRRTFDEELDQFRGEGVSDAEAMAGWASVANEDQPELWANSFANIFDIDQNDVYGEPPMGQMVQAYLRIENPIEIWMDDAGNEIRREEPDGEPDGYIIHNAMDTNDPSTAQYRSTIYQVFDGSQIKSAVGNVGAYGQRPVTADEAARLGMTQEEANNAQSRGDIRFRLGDNGVGSQQTATELAEQLREAFPGLTLDLMGRGDRATLSRIVVPQDGREQGTGTQVMQRIVQWADANGVTLALTPSSDFGGNKKRLTAFYKRFGFVENKGRNRDYEISESMYRPAQDSRYRQGAQAQRGGVSKKRFDTLLASTPARLGVQIQGFDTVAELSAHLGREMPANMKGVKTADNQIFVVRENHTDIKDVAFTIAHEQGHVGLEALLGPHLRSATNRMWANPAMRKRIKAKMAELNLQGDTAASRSEAAEEVLADMLASGERLNRDVWAKLRAGIKEFFAKLFGVQDYKVTNAEVDKLLNDVARVLRGDTPHGKYGPGDPDLGLWITDPVAAAATNDKFSRLNADFTATLDAATNEVDTQKLPPLSEFAKAAATATKDNATKLLSWAKNETFRNTFRKNFMHLNQLSSFYDNLFGGRISALADLKTASEATFNKMNARKSEWKYNGESLGTTSVNDFARTWSAFGRRQPAKHKALNTLMSQATFYKVFPDRPWDQQVDIDYDAAGYSQEDRQAAHARVTQLWSAIGTEGQRIYKTAQAMYEDRWNTRYKALIKELERIGKVNRVDNPEGAAVVDAKIAKYKDDIRLAMGKIKEGPYSPLQRNGRYTVVVTDADTGTVIHFSAYDTKEASQATAASLREQYSAENSGGNFNVVQSTREDFDARFAGTSVGDLETQRRQILEDVQSMLPADMDATARTQVAATVSNALTETYLSNLPDSAFMKHARTRKNVDGYDLDAFRAFADYQLRSARDIAGIEYDGQISHALNNIDKFVKDVTLGRMRPDGTEGVYEGDTSTLRDVADAVKRQHAASLDINRAGVVKNAIQAGYLWFMTSPSQLFLNASQTHLVAFPRLAAKYGGGLARKTLHSTMGQFFRSKGSLLSEDSVLRKNPTAENQLLLDTLQQLFDNGPLDLTQAHQVSEYAGGRDAALTPYMSKVVELASVFMHRSEVFNREVTGAAAVRMELTKRGGNIPAKGTAEYDALVQDMTKLATRAIDDTHFNYAQSNKPAIMQSNTGSLVFQFQQYRFHMLALLARDIRNARLGKALLDPVRKAMGQEVVMLSPMDAAEAREARAALAWLTGVHLTFTGATGTLLAPIVFAIMDAFKDDDDLTDSRTDFVNYFGKYISHGVLAGVIDTTRVSTATLIPYFGEKGYEPVDGNASTTFEYHVLNNLGPWVGLAGDAVDGVSALLNGDMYKASQELLPKPLRDAIKAPYEAVHGVKDANGIVYHEPSALSSFTSFLGIRSAERRDITEERSRVYKANKLARSAKDRYLNRLALAYAEGDAEGINQTQEDIAQWNQRYPDLAIRSQDIRQAIRARIRTQLVADETGISSSRMPSETINAILGR